MNQNSNKVKWYPRLFTDDMVRKILSDRKTATRWPLRKQPVEEVAKRVGEWVWEDVAGNVFHAPVRPGDVIWGRETWAHREGGPVYDAVGRVMDSFESETVYRASCPKGKGPWKPSIHMPRRYTRILLRVTGVKLVQVQDISEEEAQAEGVAPSTMQIVKVGRGMFIVFARQNFARLWDSLYSARGLGWDANPWVWAATFRRISKEEALNG